MGDALADRYMVAMAKGAVFPPVILFYDGAVYWLADGFHRINAYGRLGVAEVPADVRQGTRRDAVLYSWGARATHGYPRSNADKQRAVLTLLNDEEWSQWSDREIARRCVVHPDTVGTLRRSLSESDSDSSRTRTYTTKHGTTATMQTANIGRTTTPEPVSDPPPIIDMTRRDPDQIDIEDVAPTPQSLCSEHRLDTAIFDN